MLLYMHIYRIFGERWQFWVTHFQSIARMCSDSCDSCLQFSFCMLFYLLLLLLLLLSFFLFIGFRYSFRHCTNEWCMYDKKKLSIFCHLVLWKMKSGAKCCTTLDFRGKHLPISTLNYAFVLWLPRKNTRTHNHTFRFHWMA